MLCIILLLRPEGILLNRFCILKYTGKNPPYFCPCRLILYCSASRREVAADEHLAYTGRGSFPWHIYFYCLVYVFNLNPKSFKHGSELLCLS